MKNGQTKQFDTFDNREDRRELVILFEKLGEGLPEPMQRQVRAAFIESLIPLSVSGLAEKPLKVDPAQCSAVGAYMVFVQVVGVLGVPISEAALKLDRCVKRREWMNPKRSWKDGTDAVLENARFQVVLDGGWVVHKPLVQN